MILKYLVPSNGGSNRSESLPLDYNAVPSLSEEPIIVDNVEAPVEM